MGVLGGVMPERKRNLEANDVEEEGVDLKKLKRDVEMKESASTPNNMIAGLSKQPCASQ